jgi:hypothetical protein
VCLNVARDRLESARRRRKTDHGRRRFNRRILSTELCCKPLGGLVEAGEKTGYALRWFHQTSRTRGAVLLKRKSAIPPGCPGCRVKTEPRPLEAARRAAQRLAPPGLNDSVRLNIRPFMIAGILRKNLNVKWTKYRGTEPTRDEDDYPWFWNGNEFVGDS